MNAGRLLAGVSRQGGDDPLAIDPFGVGRPLMAGGVEGRTLRASRPASFGGAPDDLADTRIQQGEIRARGDEIDHLPNGVLLVGRHAMQTQVAMGAIGASIGLLGITDAQN